MKTIAVLITSYNRKKKTLRCLKELNELNSNLDIFLVDDNSDDGTPEAIKKHFPDVKIIKGNGNLFWCRGMYLAWKIAAKKDYEFYIWLNDDVYLYNSAFVELFQCSEKMKHQSIISGLVEDSTGITLYGGFNKSGERIQSNNAMNAITYLNGNIVLIPDYVFKIIGNFDNYFHHDLGDVDYGLRAIENNIGVYTTTKAIARGEKNNICRERLNGTTITGRFKKLYSPLGSNPFICFYYRRKHFSIYNATMYFLFLHVLNIIPDFMNKALFKDKYQ